MEVQPLFDKVLIKKITKKQEVGGFITVGNSDSQVTSKGVVVAVGDGKPLEDGTLRKLVVQKGFVVLFDDRLATEVGVGDEKYHIINEEEIFGIIKE